MAQNLTTLYSKIFEFLHLYVRTSNMNNELQIYQFQSARDFLRYAWERKKRHNPAFSIRAWAQHLGLKSHGPLQQILARNRAVPKSYLPSLVNSLGLNMKEGIYLETLIALESTANEREKSFYHDRLRTLAPKGNGFQPMALENFKLVSDPVHFLIKVMVTRSDFSSNPSWIQSKLKLKRSLHEIKNVIDRLCELKLLKKTAHGNLSNNVSHASNRVDVPDRGVQAFHEEISKMAAEQVKSQPVSEREFNAYFLNIKKGSLKEAKTRLRELVKCFMEEFEALEGTSDETFVFNIQLFRAAERGEKK
ncbi:MAG: hypothetical protein A2Z20_06515 [Bdellovibrionales bacterium RBG_16_40_8]|nr:MAG: hypothetical protein A2Z20_06515 [Bdellovibrionales bacterium RBG_16_40_8]